YGTRAHALGVNLRSTHSLAHQSSGLGFVTSLSIKPKTHERPTSNLEKMNSFSLQVSQKPSPNLRENNKAKTLENSASGSLGEHLCILDHWAVCFCFTELIRLRVLEQRVECVPSANRQACLAMLRLKLFRSFQHFCSFLRLSVHDVSNSATQD
ncbi:hypothetical protein H5410_045569, partial [Solanum commersonii]